MPFCPASYPSLLALMQWSAPRLSAMANAFSLISTCQVHHHNQTDRKWDKATYLPPHAPQPSLKKNMRKVVGSFPKPGIWSKHKPCTTIDHSNRPPFRLKTITKRCASRSTHLKWDLQWALVVRQKDFEGFFKGPLIKTYYPETKWAIF